MPSILGIAVGVLLFWFTFGFHLPIYPFFVAASTTATTIPFSQAKIISPIFQNEKCIIYELLLSPQSDYCLTLDTSIDIGKKKENKESNRVRDILNEELQCSENKDNVNVCEDIDQRYREPATGERNDQEQKWDIDFGVDNHLLMHVGKGKLGLHFESEDFFKDKENEIFEGEKEERDIRSINPIHGKKTNDNANDITNTTIISFHHLEVKWNPLRELSLSRNQELKVFNEYKWLQTNRLCITNFEDHNFSRSFLLILKDEHQSVIKLNGDDSSREKRELVWPSAWVSPGRRFTEEEEETKDETLKAKKMEEVYALSKGIIENDIGNRILFQNSIVKVWDFHILPGEDHAIHMHTNDYCFINVDDSYTCTILPNGEIPGILSNKCFQQDSGLVTWIDVRVGTYFDLEGSKKEMRIPYKEKHVHGVRNAGLKMFQQFIIEFL